MQDYVAELCITPASLRNQGAEGVVQVGRDYMKRLPLRTLAGAPPAKFEKLLNSHTEALRKEFPAKAQAWGAARKALNVFLRSAVFNRHLSEIYSLPALEPLLEIPLDQQTFDFLKLHDGGKVLPSWKGIKGLGSDESRMYQEFAGRLAAELGISRIHLELLCWRKGQVRLN